MGNSAALFFFQMSFHLQSILFVQVWQCVAIYWARLHYTWCISLNGSMVCCSTVTKWDFIKEQNRNVAQRASTKTTYLLFASKVCYHFKVIVFFQNFFSWSYSLSMNELFFCTSFPPTVHSLSFFFSPYYLLIPSPACLRYSLTISSGTWSRIFQFLLCIKHWQNCTED